MRNRGTLFLCFSLFLTACFLAPAFSPAAVEAAATKMKHSAPDYFVPDQRIKMEAQVTDPAGVKLARCYFKAAGEADLVFVPMILTGKNTYAAILPAPSASTTMINYLFLSVNNNNEVVKSQNFAIMKNAAKGVPGWQKVPMEGEIKVSMELDKAPTELRGFSDNVTIDAVESTARFGVVALLYYEATDSGSKGAVAAANASTGATSGGTITAGSAGWSTAAIVGAGVGAAVVVGGTVAAVSGGGGGGGGGGGDAEELTETTILGDWKFSGERRDGVRRTGTINFMEDGVHTYTVKDADGQSDGSGSGSWDLSGTSLSISFATMSTWVGLASGDSKKFTLDTTSGTNHGVYNFKR